MRLVRIPYPSDVLTKLRRATPTARTSPARRLPVRHTSITRTLSSRAR